MSSAKSCIDYTIGTFSLGSDLNTSREISVMPVVDFPYLSRMHSYPDINLEIICGPIAAIVKEVIIKQNSKIRMKRAAYTVLEFVQGLMVEPPQIILMSATASQVVVYAEQLARYNIKNGYSANVDYFELGNIAYKINSGSLPFFGYFSCFQINVWLLILLSALLMTAFLTIQQDNLLELPRNFWTFFVLLYTKTIPLKSITRDVNQVILVGTWLLATLVISINFSNFILDSMVKAVPKSVINSWEELYHKREVKIMTSTDDPFKQFADFDGSEMANNFKERIDSFVWEQMRNRSMEIFKNLSSGRSAFVRKRLGLIYEVMRIYKLHAKDEDISDDIYISEDGGGYIPYFIPTTKNIELDIKSRLDQIVILSRESGLLSVWNKEIYPLNNMTERPKINKDVFDYNDISLKSIADIFVLMSVSFGALFLVFFLELITKPLNKSSSRHKSSISVRRNAFTHFYEQSLNSKTSHYA